MKKSSEPYTKLYFPSKGMSPPLTKNKKIRIAKDFIVFLALVGLPSNFFGIVNPEWFYWAGFFDYRMIFLMFCALLSLFVISDWRMLLQLPMGVWFFMLVTALYVIVQFVFSSLQFGITDAFKVFRYYCMPLVAIGPLLYVLKLSRERLMRFVRWVFVATILQGIFYALHHIGFSIFYSPVHEFIYFGIVEIQRYNHAFPPYTLLILNATLLLFLFERKWYYSFFIIILLLVIILYATRSIILPTLFSATLILLITMFKQGGKVLVRIGVLVISCLVGGGLVIMFFPEYPEFVVERFLELTGPEGFRGAANYNIRMLMVENSIYDMNTLKDMLFGHGYEFRLLSEYIPGTFLKELSMQGDAPIAGLLFTEGFIGVFLRTTPFFILLFYYFRLLIRAQTREGIIVSSLVVVMISGMMLAWLQTVALRDLPYSLLPYVVLHCFYGNNRELLLHTKKIK